MKRIILLGGAGSIGTSVIKACKQNIKTHKIVAISYFTHYEKVLKIAQKLKIPNLIGPKPTYKINHNIRIFNSYTSALKVLKPEIVVNGIKGFAGLKYTITTIEQNIDLALANKESLIVGYPLIKKLLCNSKSQILPLDSEHFSIYAACHAKAENIKKIWITASGGHFYNGDKIDYNVQNVREKALSHPTWKMGAEITVNSATLMNKAFEVIEAINLFKLSYNQVEILWHKQSLIHGIVALKNGITVLIGFQHDMSIPINAILNFPNLNKYKCKFLDANKIGNWFFKPIEKSELMAFIIAKLAAKSQKNSIIMVAANEFYVNLFIEGMIEIDKILRNVYQTMQKYLTKTNPKLDNYVQIKTFYENVREFCKGSKIVNDK